MSGLPVLTYFDSRGRAEVIRWLFAYAGVDYEDRRLTREQWNKVKPNTPTKQLPMLTVDGVNLGQSGAISHYLAAKYGLNGSSEVEAALIHMIWDCMTETLVKPVRVKFSTDPEEKAALHKAFIEEDLPNFIAMLKEQLDGKNWLVGDKISLADITVGWVFYDIPGLLDCVKQEAGITSLVQRVVEHPNIKAWIENRPKQEY